MDTERVGIRQFRDRLTFYMKKVRAGHSVVILDRGVPLARVSPVRAPEEAAVWRLAEEGLVEWAGGKPLGALAASTPFDATAETRADAQLGT